MADGREPICQAMIFCDSIYLDPWIGKRTFLGVFSSYETDSFPLLVPELAIHIVLTECLGSMPIRVRVVDVNEQFEPVAEGTNTLECQDPLVPIEVDVRFRGIVFERPGDYVVQLIANDHLVMDRKLVVGYYSEADANGP